MNFIPAELTSQDGRPAVTFPLENGSAAVLALARPAPAVADRQVVLGVRPEHFFRFDPDLPRESPASRRCPAPVEVVEPTGAETMAVLRFGALEVVRPLRPGRGAAHGRDPALGIDMAHACLFDPATQKLI